MKTLFYMILAAIVVVLAGCETESSDNISISISPSNVTLAKGESQTFTASGWRDYTWSLNPADTTMGVLSTTKGDSTVYTAIKGAAEENETETVFLVLTVNIPVDDVTEPTDTDSLNTGNVSATALITHSYSP